MQHRAVGGKKLHSQKQTPVSRKGFKLKRKSKEQVAELRKFFKRTQHGKWQRHEIEELASRIKLDFKSTNKWLWDKKNRIEMANIEKQHSFVRQTSILPGAPQIFSVQPALN